MGVSVETADFTCRIGHLRKVPASIRYLSIEPLLGPLHTLPLRDIDWVIVGGESGPKAREMKAEWVRPIRDKCLSEGIPFFFKQWGGTRRAKTGKVLDGRIWNELPR
jgi:protein gp37